MIPGAALYTQPHKARHFTDAMRQGFPAVEVASESGRLDAAARLHILGGLQFGCLELMRQIRREGLEYVFWDRAYLGGGTKTDRLRLTRNQYQKATVDAGRSLERFEAFGGSIRPWRKSGSHILLVPPGDALLRLFGIPGAVHQWIDERLAALKAATDRPVRVSHKGDKVPLEQRLRDCHCVVTWTSNVAVEAILAGVPAFTARAAAAAPVAGDVAALDGVEQPPCPDREAWAASLAWGQFTVEEIRSGFARAVVLEGWT